MKQPAYEYIARYVDNYDGDTVRLDVDLGFHVTVRETFRLWGINCPELKGETKRAGERSRDALRAKLEQAGELVIKTQRGQEKFGRWLCEIQVNGESMTVNDWLVANRLAVEYMR